MSAPRKTSAYHQALIRFKTFYWLELLRQTDGNIALASRHAGVNRTHVHKLLIACGIERTSGRRAGKPWHGDWGDLHDRED